MKKIFLVIIMVACIVACSNDNKPRKTNELSDGLRELYSFVEGLSAKTRSGSLFVPNIKEVGEISSAMSKMYYANDMNTVVANSGYYNKSIDMTTADIYDYLQYIEKNGTEEYYDLIIKFLSNENILLESVISNKDLLPTEQLTLTVLLGINNAPINEDRIKGCLTVYRSDVRACETIRFAINTVETTSEQAIRELNKAYDTCISTANTRFKNCSAL